MRIVLVAAAAAALIGCGGKIASTAEDSNSDTSVVGKCAYGEIGRAPGAPFGVASTGDTVFVFGAPIVGSGASSDHGNLYSVSSTGSTLIAQGIASNVVAVGNAAAYLRLEQTTGGYLRGTNLQTAGDDGSVTQVDVVDDSFVDISSITFDGKNKLAWYRWPTLLVSGQPRPLPSIASTTAPGQPITTASIDPDVLGVGAFVTDGTHDYAVFDTSEDGRVIGILPVNADPKVVLVQSWAQPAEVYAVDDTMLLYETEGGTQGNVEYWEVPKAGGQSLLAADVPLPGVAPLLHDHNIYWVDDTSGTPTIWGLSEIENSIPKVIATVPSGVFAMAADSCGIVYTTLDGPGTTGIVARAPY